MSKKIRTLPLADAGLAGTNGSSAQRKRLAYQRILDAIPAQIDAIKEERVSAAIKLYRFMAERERDEKIKRTDTAQLNGWAKPAEGSVWAPDYTIHYPQHFPERLPN